MSLKLRDGINHHCRCRREFKLGKNKSLEEFVIGLRKEKESANEESKQFDLGERKRGATALKSGCAGIILFFWGMHGLGCPACFFCICLSACFVSVSFCFILQKKSGDVSFSAS